jgi:hypothetical protein
LSSDELAEEQANNNVDGNFMQTIGLSFGLISKLSHASPLDFICAADPASTTTWATDKSFSRNIKLVDRFLKNITLGRACVCVCETCLAPVVVSSILEGLAENPKKTRWARTQNEQRKEEEAKMKHMLESFEFFFVCFLGFWRIFFLPPLLFAKNPIDRSQPQQQSLMIPFASRGKQQPQEIFLGFYCVEKCTFLVEQFSLSPTCCFGSFFAGVFFGIDKDQILALEATSQVFCLEYLMLRDTCWLLLLRKKFFFSLSVCLLSSPRSDGFRFLWLRFM